MLDAEGDKSVGDRVARLELQGRSVTRVGTVQTWSGWILHFSVTNAVDYLAFEMSLAGHCAMNERKPFLMGL